jgi:hypothetical protein
MTFLFTEYEVGERLRELDALDRRLERWGWFRRHENRPPDTGWRFRVGEALIRLGNRLQERGGARAERTFGKP